jgi:CDP-diacylglycerol--glycerol-3-phosphate 3-phosphatidyltransferase
LNPDTVLAGLHHCFLRLVLYGGLAIASGGVVLACVAGAQTGLGWTALALGIWLSQGLFVGGRLGLNHHAGETGLLSTFGPGTNATLLRGWLLACLAGFLLVPRSTGFLAWAPAVIYALADGADYLDGYLARVSNHATSLGEALDIEFDGLGLLIAVSVAVRYSALPIWYLPVGLARYAFLLGSWARQRAGRSIYPLPQSDSRRPLAGLQMGALSLILIPVLRPPVTTLGGVILAIPLLVGFARDWLVVSGAVDPESARYRRTRELARSALLRWLPVILRVIVIGAVIRLVSIPTGAEAAVNAGSLVNGSSVTGGLGGILRLVELATAVAIALGISPRIASALLIAALLVRGSGGDSSPTLLEALACSVGVVMVGGGALSIWQPEIPWLSHRAGEGRMVE